MNGALDEPRALNDDLDEPTNSGTSMLPEQASAGDGRLIRRYFETESSCMCD